MALNVKQRLILITTLTIFISSISTFFLNQHIFTKILYSKFKDKINFIGKHLASSVAIGIVLKNNRILENIADSILSNKDVTGVAIEDKNGSVIYTKGIINNNFTVKFPVQLSRPKDNAIYYPQDNKILGYIKVSYTTKNLDKLVKKLFIHSLILAIIISIAIGIIVYIFTIIYFVSPFKELLMAVSRVSKGDLNFSVPAKGMPETKELAIAFSNMVHSLKKNMKLLKSTYEEMIYQKFLAEIGKVAFVIAHEVKNPLGIIKGSIDIIKKPEIDTKTKEDMILYIEEEITKLDKFIRDFLHLARPKRPELVDLKLRDFMNNLKQKVLMEYPEKIFNIVIKQDIYLATDISLMERIFINLIKNAYEAGADTVTIEVYEKNDIVTIKVKDNGEGIPEEDRDKIFEPFYTTKQKGSGLGLVFVAQGVYSLKGKIEVTSNTPKGTIFTIYFKESLRKVTDSFYFI